MSIIPSTRPRGWDKAAAKTHPDYTASSKSCGTAWFGMVWTMRNLPIVDGLVDIGRYDLAAELAWKTIQAIIEYLFGVDCDIHQGCIRIFPLIPSELACETISIKNVLLPTTPQMRLSLTVSPDKTSGARLIDVKIDGDLSSDIRLEVLQSQTEAQPAPEVVDPPVGLETELIKESPGLESVVGIRVPICPALKVRF